MKQNSKKLDVLCFPVIHYPLISLVQVVTSCESALRPCAHGCLDATGVDDENTPFMRALAMQRSG